MAFVSDEGRDPAAAEAHPIKDDPVDRAEIEAIHGDLAALQPPTVGWTRGLMSLRRIRRQRFYGDACAGSR